MELREGRVAHPQPDYEHKMHNVRVGKREVPSCNLMFYNSRVFYNNLVRSSSSCDSDIHQLVDLRIVH